MITPNSIIQGDCLEWLDRVKPNSVDLCYIDPPFFTKRNFKDFTDTWWGGRDTYLTWMRRRIQKIHRVLKSTGSIFLHCDHHANYTLRIILDDIFGEKNFLNEIVWCYGVGGRGDSSFAKKHDTIFFYSKGNDFKFNNNKIKVPYELLSPKSVTNFNLSDKDGRKYRDKTSGNKVYRYYEDLGKIPNDWWIDIQPLTGRHGRDERIDYATQKPESLLKRIIKCSTKEGDLVLDCFGGSGTTAAVAKKLGRDYIIGDVNPESIKIMTERLKEE